MARDIIVGIGNIIHGDQLIANVVAVLFIVLGGTAAEEVVGVDVGGISGVGDGGEEVTVGFVTPCDHGVIGIGEGGFEIGTREVVPAEAVGFGDTAGGGVIGDGLFAVAIHAIAHIATEGVPMAGESLGVKTVHLLGGELPEGIIREGCGADGIGGGGLAAHRVVGVGEADAVGKRHGGLAAAGTTPDGYRYAVHEVGFFGEVSLKGIFMREFIQLSACLY